MYTQPTVIDLNSDEFHYDPFIISMSRFIMSCDTVKDPLGRRYVPNKIEDVNQELFNIIKRINESKALRKHTSC